MTCTCSFYVECPYMFDVSDGHLRIVLDERETCPYCNEKCYEKEGKEE